MDLLKKPASSSDARIQQYKQTKEHSWLALAAEHTIFSSCMMLDLMRCDEDNRQAKAFEGKSAVWNESW